MLPVRSLYILFTCFIISVVSVSAQPAPSFTSFLGRLRTGGSVPNKLLRERSVVIYDPSFTQGELITVQESFKDTGIDAIAYFKTSLLLAGHDMATALAFYFNKRHVENLVLLEKEATGYHIYITGFNTKGTFVEQNQMAWDNQSPSLSDMLRATYRTAANSQERDNFLVNVYPETDLTVSPIAGRRSEFFGIDLKVDPTAVPKTGDDVVDAKLEEIFSSLYPFKYKLTEVGKSEKELRFEGSFYVLRYIYAPMEEARQILGYPPNDSGKPFETVTYPNGQPQTKQIAANTPVYKFYFKHIDSGNVFLGTQWDADTTWEQALRNHIIAFKAELKLN